MTGTKRSSEVPISVLAESRGVGVGGVSLQVRHTGRIPDFPEQCVGKDGL